MPMYSTQTNDQVSKAISAIRAALQYTTEEDSGEGPASEALRQAETAALKAYEVSAPDTDGQPIDNDPRNQTDGGA